MRVAFLHPDLGLGGAERLVVDAAAGLAHLGHDVTMYTSHYNPERSFAETRDGSFPVRVHGDWLPRHICGAFLIVFAILRNLYLALAVALSREPIDVFVVDQISACIPILRLLRPRAAVVFYCHFPDLLLSDRRTAAKRLYRVAFDWLEEVTTGCAHDIVVNSNFTRDKFAETFSTLARRGRKPAVLYPCIAIADAPTLPPQSSPRILLSVNRYERKKDVGLAIKSFAALVREGRAGGAHLVIAGGYDPRLAENVEHYAELRDLARSEGLFGDAGAAAGGADASRVLRNWPTPVAAPVDPTLSLSSPPVRTAVDESFAHVTFLRSFSDAEKAALLAAAAAVLYTPANEHFGIVPLECMAARRPVVAAASGGPLESVVPGVTGFLCTPTPEAFAAAIAEVLAMSPARAAEMGRAGRAHVVGRFSRDAFARQLAGICAAQTAACSAGRGRSFGL